jgi:hypothetical protein
MHKLFKCRPVDRVIRAAGAFLKRKLYHHWCIFFAQKDCI